MRFIRLMFCHFKKLHKRKKWKTFQHWGDDETYIIISYDALMQQETINSIERSQVLFSCRCLGGLKPNVEIFLDFFDPFVWKSLQLATLTTLASYTSQDILVILLVIYARFYTSHFSFNSLAFLIFSFSLLLT